MKCTEGHIHWQARWKASINTTRPSLKMRLPFMIHLPMVLSFQATTVFRCSCTFPASRFLAFSFSAHSLLAILPRSAASALAFLAESSFYAEFEVSFAYSRGNSESQDNSLGQLLSFAPETCLMTQFEH